MSEFNLGDSVILPPSNKRGTVKAWRYEDFGSTSRPRREQVIDVRFHDGSATTMRAAYFLPAEGTGQPTNHESEG